MTVTLSKAAPDLPAAERKENAKSHQVRCHTELSVLVIDQRVGQSTVAIWITVSSAADEGILLRSDQPFLSELLQNLKGLMMKTGKCSREAKTKVIFLFPVDHIHGHLMSRTTSHRYFGQASGSALLNRYLNLQETAWKTYRWGYYLISFALRSMDMKNWALVEITVIAGGHLQPPTSKWEEPRRLFYGCLDSLLTQHSKNS